MARNKMVWARRLADIPGVGYQGMSEADRQRIKGHDAVPQVHRFGDGLESLWWGDTTASPASDREFPDQDLSTRHLLKHLSETLELPGIPSDYHFAIQHVIGELMGRRADEPEVLDEVERLCLVNIALVEATPDAVMVDMNGDPARGYYQMLCFSTLITLYEEEGALPQAFAIAQKAARFGQGDVAQDRIMARHQAVLAEDAG